MACGCGNTKTPLCRCGHCLGCHDERGCYWRGCKCAKPYRLDLSGEVPKYQDKWRGEWRTVYIPGASRLGDRKE